MKNIFDEEDETDYELIDPDLTANSGITAATALSDGEKAKLLNMEQRIRKRIIGQDTAISEVCKAIRRNQVGFKDAERPVGSFIFLGTTGTGKTELCRALAEILYGDKSKLVKIDMSEYMTKWDSSKLLGAAPGYLGYEAGGQLTNLIKRYPKSVLCLDEIEKSHPDIFNILLQILEDGVLTSGQGEVISFKDVLIIMTSNIGSADITHENKPIGFSKNVDTKESINRRIMHSLKKTFKPEFLNRIDATVIFNQLSEKHVLQICRNMLKKVKQKAQKLGIKLEFDKSVISELARLGYDPEYGARPLRRVISAKIEDMLADKVLMGELNPGDNIRIILNNGDFDIIKKKSVKAAILQMEDELLW